jgi:hypothetical protein
MSGLPTPDDAGPRNREWPGGSRWLTDAGAERGSFQWLGGALFLAKDAGGGRGGSMVDWDSLWSW